MSELTYKLHECESLPRSGVQVVYSAGEGGGYDNAWTLVITREATEEDLQENHYLENVGDIIWQTMLEITYCPYCGDGLSDGLQEENLKRAQLDHHDFSRW